jgi:predicted metal-dependent hydrolase
VDDAMDEALREWVRLFNAGAYFEAHEALEGAWLRARGPDREFLKGLIHAAVALHHYRRGNGHGARVKHRSAAAYLAPFQPDHRGIPVAALLRQLESFFAPLHSLPAGSPPPPAACWPVCGGAFEE